ncbi:alpha-L-arabinofuranosidase C-terminal domain-containing protein [Promicromonospora panici]|uniref:alpha-L-arabinofuranosidase C-terminal domain-containing protein n=1 Tax=Promicromonospora panici TaxID=2219658 RepID=UPI00101CC5FA|nr:alpha-L-arabinofuranosidase C-terminal domain-containing protein [Promicromonospora panici]
MTIVTVDLDDPRPISPDLWGAFFEDINCSADGGLYAELVRNRSFDFTSQDRPGWGPLTGWTTRGLVQVRSDSPLSPASPTYVRIGDGSTSAEIVNEGFGGITVAAGESYVFSVYARATNDVDLDVTLACSEGRSTASVAIAAGPDWVRYEAVFNPTFGDGSARLGVAVQAGDTVDLDLVSLFPQRVFRGSPNGMREDLAQSIADLSPRFLRFPGGCVAHGLGLSNMYRWPGTIGPLQDRRPDSNIWGYHQSMGIGYFEYFRFCEQIAATPLPVVPAGVCCQNTPGGPQPVPDHDMDAYLQEVLDLVEFANGDETTRWGSLRGELGHPAPFGLRYLGLGNEDQIDDVFEDRFGRIFAAIRREYPEITVVGTAGPQPFGEDYDRGWDLGRRLGVPVLDEHCYKAPKWLFQNLHRYDDYDRTGPAVYLGEYGSRGNTFLNALAEAAFMTGMERNGDVVRLASYAPLLAKVGSTQWVPDLIYFDSSDVLPSLNYHVQQLFSETGGDESLPVSVLAAPVYERPAPRYRHVGLRADGFTVDCGWITIAGAATDSLVVDDGTGVQRIATPLLPHDFTIELDFTAVAGDPERGSLAVLFGDLDSAESWEWNLGTWMNRTATLFEVSDGFRDEACPGIPFSIEVGRRYAVRIEVRDGGRVTELHVDGRLVNGYEDPRSPEERFAASCVRDTSSGRTTVRLVNATGTATTVQLETRSGAPVSVLGGRQLSGDAGAGAPFEPAPFAPHEIRPTGSGVTVPGFSVTMVEIAAESAAP